MGAFIASALAITGTIGNLVTICALLQVQSSYTAMWTHSLWWSQCQTKLVHFFVCSKYFCLTQMVKLHEDVFDDNTSCFKSRLRTHPTSLCLVALAASDLVFCVYNLPLTAYQVISHLYINSWIISFLSVFSSGLWLFLSGLAALYVRYSSNRLIQKGCHWFERDSS